MTTLNVGHSATYPSIAAAMSKAQAGDTVALASGYSGETATVTRSGITIVGDASNLGITLRLGAGVGTFTVNGAAPINVFDSVSGESTVGNTITGGAGRNVITVSGGVDAVSGGLGTDRLVVNYAAAGGAVTGDSTSNFTDAGGGRTVTITDGTFEHFTIRTGSFADTITTGAGNDDIYVGRGANTVTAGEGANRIIGGRGADTFTALGGGNFMDGGNGANVLTSGAGNDTIRSGTGADTIVAGGGRDTITVRGGADTVKAGGQHDRLIVDYAAVTTNVTGTLNGSIETGYTGHFADRVGGRVDFSNVERFLVMSGSGDDSIATGGGIDTIRSGAGNDTLNGGAGTDRLIGGAGNDVYILASRGDTVVEREVGGIDRVRAAYSYTLEANLEKLLLTGTAAINGLGNALNNRMTGNAADNMLVGLRGNDVLSGGSGDDVLRGGSGRDVLIGGLGSDDFVFLATSDSASSSNSRDVISAGFSRGFDDIVVSNIDAKAGIEGNQAFAIDMNRSFSQGEIRQTVLSSGVLVEFNTDSDPLAEMAILIQGLTRQLADTDFIL